MVNNQLFFGALAPELGTELYKFVENSPPTNINLSASSLPENSGANAVIGTLSGLDPDLYDTLAFSLPTGLSNNNLFNINGTSLRANNSFNYEVGTSLPVTVRVTDSAG